MLWVFYPFKWPWGSNPLWLVGKGCQNLRIDRSFKRPSLQMSRTTITTHRSSLAAVYRPCSQFSSRPPWWRQMWSQWDLWHHCKASCDVTVVVICYDVTVLFTICHSLERRGSPLISWTACCPTGHEVEWPLGVNREACNLLDGTRLWHFCVCVTVCAVRVHVHQNGFTNLGLWFASEAGKAVNTWTKAFCQSLSLCPPCCSAVYRAGWSHVYDSVKNKTR